MIPFPRISLIYFKNFRDCGWFSGQKNDFIAQPDRLVNVMGDKNGRELF